ncbi:MAG: hypothetical protein P4M13_03645 [Alphaproteobacteria bacterium]|nr:hypothetical protein [Alphaproteobacteria bacterium]
MPYEYEKNFWQDRVIVPAASLVGRIARVEKRPDVYRGYYLTACELANPAKLHPKQLALLKNDSTVLDASWIKP